METAIQAALELVKIIRAGELLEKKARVLQLLGEIFSGIGNWLETHDDGDDGVFRSGGPEPETLEACCDEIEQQLGSEAPTLGPVAIALLVKLAEFVIARILKNL